ncbi:MAG: hypothetical protein AAFV93_12250 [Chloroflexota bacterium]
MGFKTSGQFISYLILKYGEDGTMASISPMFIDSDLFHALVEKMISEGAKIITESEAEVLWEKMEAIHNIKAKESERLIKLASERLKDKQFIKNALKELLDNLDEVADKHPEVRDTMVREILCDTILQLFVFNTTNEKLLLGDCDEYAMYSDKGNQAVDKALTQFLNHPEVKTARQQLKIPEERLVVFQDSDIESSKGNHFGTYFGWVSSL